MPATSISVFTRLVLFRDMVRIAAIIIMNRINIITIVNLFGELGERQLEVIHVILTVKTN